MPYRVARVPGDSRRLVLHPERGLGTKLLIGLGAASATVGVVLATQHPAAGVVVALASSAFGPTEGAMRVVVELATGERVGLTPYQASEAGLDELRRSVAELLASGGATKATG